MLRSIRISLQRQSKTGTASAIQANFIEQSLHIHPAWLGTSVGSFSVLQTSSTQPAVRSFLSLGG